MLRFQLRQLYVPSLSRYFLPLPKLTGAQMRLLSAHLEGRGFGIRPGRGLKGRVAAKGAQHIAIDGALGLATSTGDLLDALAPAIPPLLALGSREAGKSGADAAALYLSLKRSGASVELQLFPRMESLRTWSCLRRDGLCGLTPDEAAVLKHLLGRASGSAHVECVTARPRQGSRALQEGRRLYYRSEVPVAEFLDSLRTIDSDGADSASYLPRDSVISLPRVRVDARIQPAELGEWCFAG
ncbi:MAG TPA: hypothetical protein VFB30_00905 [Spirochaetia bacterium]|nr:hypothetical protein [Spirochaetia bacterium]